MLEKNCPISFKGHESFGVEMMDIYSVLGVLRNICLQHYQNPMLPVLARQAQEIVNALTVELDKQFKEDFPSQYNRHIYFH